MPYFGSNLQNVSNRSMIEHLRFLGSDADVTTNLGVSTFYVNYTPENVSVIVQGNYLLPSDFEATNGKDIRISSTINNTDVIEIIGYNVRSSVVLERTDVHITAGKIGGVDVSQFKEMLERIEALETQVANLS